MASWGEARDAGPFQTGAGGGLDQGGAPVAGGAAAGDFTLPIWTPPVT